MIWHIVIGVGLYIAGMITRPFLRWVFGFEG